MENSNNQPLFVCGCCKKELPRENFYEITNHRRDSYCKDCRRTVSHERYDARRCARVVEERVYPVITRMENRETRLAFIRHALQVVAESMKRKQRKVWDAECELVSGSNF